MSKISLSIITITLLVILAISCNHKDAAKNIQVADDTTSVVDTTAVIEPEDTTASPTIITDTTYITTPEAPQTKKVLAEEFTGVSCPPCPNGHDIMKSIKTSLNDNLIVISYHILNYPQAAPVDHNGHKSKYDFRTEESTKIGSEIFGGISGMPTGGFDRVPQNGELTLNTALWSNAAETSSKNVSPVNIHITSSYDTKVQKGTAIITLAYTTDVIIDQNLTVAITENGIVDAQKKNFEVIDDYNHEHVLRDIITPFRGYILPASITKLSGTVIRKVFTFEVGSSWNLDNCNIVAFVTNNSASDKKVVNAEEVKLTGQ